MDLFDLVAKITLDSSEYEKGVREAGDEVASFSSKWGAVGKVASIAGAATVAAVSASAVAVGKLTKQSVEAYANYEQLAGGVKKLYGDAADELMRYAEQGYKTSGMSSNKYMELATSFSAALINSLDGDASAAAKQTDVAMRAISDNFNTFGGDIQNVQNAFQGFAKQNYTMLDNLKLGYGGTKTEMERLIADANEYAEANGMAADLSIDSFSDIVTAIDLIQQKQGIAGTTAREAATTIEGALNMTKAAWENLVTGFADPDADIGKLMDNLVVAIVGENEGEGLLNQVIPAIQRALDGVGQLLESAAPILAQQIPPLVMSMLPPLISSATSLVGGLVSALPSIIQVLIEQVPMVLETMVTALTDALPMLAEVAPQIILTLSEGISASLPTLIPAVVECILAIVNALISNVDLLVTAAIALIEGLATGVVNAIPILISQAPTIIKSLVSALLKGVGQMLSAGLTLIGNFATGIFNGFASIPSKVSALARKIPTAIKNGVGSLASIGRNMIDGLWGGIKAKFDGVVEKVKSLAAGLPKAVKKVLGISSPSKVFMEVGRWIPEGLALGIERNMGAVYNASDMMADATTFTPEDSGMFVDGMGEGYGKIEINVYATPEQSAMEIAQQVKRVLIKETNGRRLAWT